MSEVVTFARLERAYRDLTDKHTKLKSEYLQKRQTVKRLLRELKATQEELACRAK